MEELEQLPIDLKPRRILEIYNEQLRSADMDDISHSDFITRLVRAQSQATQEGALEWRNRRANLPERRLPLSVRISSPGANSYWHTGVGGA